MSYVTPLKPYEPGRIPTSEVWLRWEGQIVNGIFPLRRLLGSSNHGAVFLSEYTAGNLPDVAIKLVPADALQAEPRLAHWRAAATLSHPHLIRLFDVGRFRLGGREFLFVVMEHAEQTLAQILCRRALSSDEVRDMLLPTLDALAFLHRNQLVHGQLKPSNVLAVNDQLKLASDTIRPIGNSGNGVGHGSYEPPEWKARGISTAGDIWSLGITLVEALTQRTPTWSDEQCETLSLRVSIPAPFLSTVRQCLNLTPANRPTVIHLQTQYGSAPQAHLTSDHQPPADELPLDTPTSRNFPKRHWLPLTFAGALVASLVVWIGLRSGTSQADLQPRVAPTLAPTLAPVAPSTNIAPAQSSSGFSSPVARPADMPSPPPAATSPSIALQVTPDVPPAILDKIRGRILVTVRVLVAPSGNVIGALMENPGPSRYFARLADEAAREWKFAAADDQADRVWLLRFAFTRGGVTAHATVVQ